ncbi:hypothetical protein [Streptomyces sp. NPDC001930]|uniref:hypothetical protein n=1 Tax=Streptomyces sp. NPDC001930 TaxID=3364625 RepID=UPI0036ACD434
MPTGQPDQTYAQLRATYEKFTQDQDPFPLIQPETSHRLQELLEWLVEPMKEPGSPPAARVAALLAWIHWARWQHSRSRDGGVELDRAILVSHLLRDGQGAPAPLQPLVRLGQRAMQSEPPDLLLLQDYAGLLVGLAERHGCEGALAEGLRRLTQVLEQLSEDDPKWPSVAANLCAAVLVECELTGTSPHIDRALDVTRKALGGLDLPSGDLARVLNQFGRLLVTRHFEHPRLADLDEAIEIQTRASELEGVPTTIVRRVLTDLSHAWYLRHLQSGRRDDLDRVINVLSAVVPDRGELGTEFQPIAEVLASALGDRGRIRDSVRDPQRAVALRRRLTVERGRSHDHLELARMQGLLYERTGRSELLDESVHHYEKAKALAEADGISSPGALAGLAWSLHLRFERSGDVADRDGAIAAGRLSVASTPQSDGALGRRLAIFAAALTARATSTGSTPDLNDGLAVIERALALPDESDSDRAIQLFNKSALMGARYATGKDPEDIRSQITLCHEALDLLPDGHPKKGVYRANLVGAYLELHRSTDDTSALELALAAGDLALSEIPADHPRRGGVLSNQAVALTRSAEEEYDEAKLRNAVRLSTEALGLLPEGSPPDARLLVNRGSALYLCGRPEDRVLALQDWRSAALSEAAPPDVRMAAATGWGRLSGELGRWDEAVRAYTVAVDLLTSVAGLHLEREDQEHQLTNWSHVTSDAAATALEAGDPEKALELLEAGRCVQWNHQLRNAGELALLADKRPDLAAKAERVTAALGVMWFGTRESEDWRS